MKITKHRLSALLTASVVFGSAHCMSVQAADTPWTSSNRIAISADGNPDADADDTGASPFTLAVLAKAGLQANLVHYDFNNFLNYKRIEPVNNRMWLSAMGGQTRWGFDSNTFFDAAIHPDAAIAHLTAEINKSTAGDPLYLILAGPMELIYQALESADATARQHVVLVSHHNYNELFKARLWHRNIDDVRELVPDIGYVKIPDQNSGGLKGSDDAEFHWLRDHADANLNWVYERIVAGTPDVSDAGMLTWLIGINGTDGVVTIDEMKTWFGADLIATNGGSTITPDAPDGVTPEVIPPVTESIFEEVDGKIVIEAESVPLTDDWILDTTEEDYSGTGYIRWMPSWINEISTQHRGVLVYKLRITNPGTYRMALRSSHKDAPARDKWNDCWTVMGINPVSPYGITRKTYHSISDAEFNNGVGFNWNTTHNNYGSVASTDGEFSAPTYELESGDHFFYILGRSGGYRIDKIHFFKEGVDGFKSDSEPATPILPGVGVPVVSAGPSQTHLMPVTGAQLSGTASDDNGTIVSTVWSQKSGPTTATIADAGQLNTSISDITFGTYVFTLTIEDNDGNVRTADVAIEFVGSITIQEDDFSSYNGSISGANWNPKWSGGTDQQNLHTSDGSVATIDTTVAAENYHTVAKHGFALDLDGQKAVMSSDFRYDHMAGGNATTELNKPAMALAISPKDTWWDGDKILFNLCNRGTGIGVENSTGSEIISHTSLGVDTTAGGVSDWFRLEWTIKRGSVNYVATPEILSHTGEVLYTGNEIDLGIANGTTIYGGYSTGGSGGNATTTTVASYSRFSSVQMDNYKLTISSPNMAPEFEADSIALDAAQQNQLFTGSFAAYASDPNSDTLSFSKTSGPAWLTVHANGSFEGTPGVNELGENSFLIEVQDPDGATDTATFTLSVQSYHMVYQDDFSSAAYTSTVRSVNWTPKEPNAISASAGYGVMDLTKMTHESHTPCRYGFALQEGGTAVITSDFRYKHQAGLITESFNKSVLGLVLSSKPAWSGAQTEVFGMCNRGKAMGNVLAGNPWVEGWKDHTSVFGVNTTEGGLSDWFQIKWTITCNASNYSASARVQKMDGTLIYDATQVELSQFAPGTTVYPGYSPGYSIAGKMLAEFTGLEEIHFDNFKAEIYGSASSAVFPSYSEWAEAMGLSDANNAPELDADGDGHSNQKEYVIGTDPNNGTSLFAIDTVQQEVDGKLIISWDSKPGRRYTIMTTTNINEEFSVIATDISYPQSSYTVDLSQTQSTGFYKAAVQMP